MFDEFLFHFFPLGDKTTLADFLEKIEAQYGPAQRIWVMDRGIPTEAVLEQMRATDPPVPYLVGTPRGRLSQYEQKLLPLPWQVAREGVSVKLLAEGAKLYVLAQSQDRVNKERAMRRRQLKGLWERLEKLQAMKLKRDELLKKPGAALHDYPVGARLVETTVPAREARLTFTLRKDKLRQARKREGRYLLRTNLAGGRTAEELWPFHIQSTEVPEATALKTDTQGLARYEYRQIAISNDCTTMRFSLIFALPMLTIPCVIHSGSSTKSGTPLLLLMCNGLIFSDAGVAKWQTHRT